MMGERMQPVSIPHPVTSPVAIPLERKKEQISPAV